jgi:hypothetical protein
LIKKEKNKKFQTKLNQKKFIKEKCKKKTISGKKKKTKTKKKEEKVKCITVCTVIHFTVHCHSDIKNRSNKSEKKKMLLQ